jgi:hypothetical protein
MGTIKIKKDGEWVKLPNYGIEEFPDAPSDGKIYGRKNKQWSEIIASNQYLDLTTLFSNESGTLSDEDYQKIVDAWENRVSLAQVYSSYVPMVIEKNEGGYSIAINMTMYDPFGMSVSVVTTSIDTDKTYTRAATYLPLYNNGTGTKYLSDNGQYKAITTSSGVLPQETQNNILDAINAIKFTDKSKTTVTAQEYNNIISAFDGKITPNNDNMWNISYDKMTPSKFTSTGTEAPIFGAYLVFDEFNTISIISYSTFYDYYYAIMANANVGGITLEIKDANYNYKLTYKNNTGIPVTGGSGVSEITSLSQSAYDKLTEKKNTTLYIITG